MFLHVCIVSLLHVGVFWGVLFCFVCLFVFFFRFRGLLIVLFYFDIFCKYLMHRWYRYFSDWNICFLYTFNECILGLFTCWNVNHHSVLSIVILIMLIIVTVSSQDTALYIKLHWIHFCYCTQGLKYLPFFKRVDIERVQHLSNLIGEFRLKEAQPFHVILPMRLYFMW